MRRVQLADLKARLSEYLDDVRAGAQVVIFDRATPVARIVPFDVAVDDDLDIVEPSAPLSSLNDLATLRLRRRFDVQRLLRESRGDR